jgi:hypothetical protein
VLGPGGVVGTAWMTGLASGLRRDGVDLAETGTEHAHIARMSTSPLWGTPTVSMPVGVESESQPV